MYLSVMYTSALIQTTANGNTLVQRPHMDITGNNMLYSISAVSENIS